MSQVDTQPAYEDPATPGRIVELLSQGEVTVLGQIPWRSNVIFLTNVDDGDLSTDEHAAGLFGRSKRAPHSSVEPKWGVLGTVVLLVCGRYSSSA